MDSVNTDIVVTGTRTRNPSVNSVFANEILNLVVRPKIEELLEERELSSMNELTNRFNVRYGTSLSPNAMKDYLVKLGYNVRRSGFTIE